MSLRRSARVSATSSTPTKRDAAVSTQKRPIVGDGTEPRVSKKAKKQADGTDVAEQGSPFKVPAAPTTPIRKQRSQNPKAPPLTPTPSLINVIRAPYSSGDIDDATPPPADRPVEPHITNATLVTPGRTQSVAYGDLPPDSTPSRIGMPQPSATSGTLLDQACAHLIAVDPKMKPVVEKYRCSIFAPEGLAEEIDPFRSLSSGIMGQQVSGAAAKAIKNKFVALFNDPENTQPKFPTPAQVVETDITRLRSAGLSQRKAEYIKGLAEKFISGDLSTSMLMRGSDEEVMEKLIAVRGLGKWSVEMFMCFGLKRLDVLSTGDLGVQRGMAAHFGRDVKKLKAKGGGKWKYMSEEDMLQKSAVYAPYRSLFMWYMWRVEDVDVTVMNDD